MPENKKFWKFCNQAGNKVELLLYGDISQTSWWGDEVTPKQFAEELAGLGALDEICFTDHVEPMEWGSTKLRAPYDWSLLTRDFRAAQAAVGDQIQLRLGIELGDAEWAPEHAAELLIGAPEFDFVIGSIHLLSKKYRGEDLYVFSPKDESEAQAALGDYLEEALALAKQGGFTKSEAKRS